MIAKDGHTLFGNYVPPSDSIYFDDTCFADLCNAFLPKNSDYAVIGGGDFNARFGNLHYAPIPGSKYRINCDEIINSHGRILKRICSSNKCYILNNLTLPGKYLMGNLLSGKEIFRYLSLESKGI